MKDNYKVVIGFDQLSSNDVAIAGGKGASLGEMLQAGFSVPEGFVITVDAFEDFLEKTNLSVEINAALDSVDHKKMHTVESASEKIQALILNAAIPEDTAHETRSFFKELNADYVAVRSSATAEDSSGAAWAGQLDSFLNTTEDTLLENVKKCWASLFTPRAIYYRFEKELNTKKISVAVIVQKMIQSDISGIAFSVHPVTQDKNQMIIEAGFGLGEAIVSGAITPDTYVVEKDTHTILDKKIGTQTKELVCVDGKNTWIDLPEEKGGRQALSDVEIIELGKIIEQLEKHYGFPVDSEWVIKEGKCYIVQSRPITTLVDSDLIGDDTKKTQFLSSIKKFPKWVPIAERDICFLLRELILEGHKSDIYNDALGISVPPIGMAMVNDHVFSPIESIQITNQALQELMSKFGPLKIAEIGDSCLAHAKELHEYLENAEITDVTEYVEQLKRLYIRLVCYLLIVVFSESFLEKQVEKLIQEKVGKEDKRYFEGIIYVRKFNKDTEELLAIIELSKLIKNDELDINSDEVIRLLQKHVDEYGWIGTRWQLEDGWIVDDIKQRIIRYVVGNPEQELEKILQPRKEAEAITKEFIDKFNLTDEEQDLISLVKEFVFLRTFRTESLSRANFLMKPFLRKAAQQLHISEHDILFLTLDEISDAISTQSDYASLIEQRKDGSYMILCGDTIEMFVGEKEDLIDNLGLFTVMSTDDSEITGQTAWRGIVQGKVKIVKKQKDIAEVEDGDILVAVMTFPNYIPAMERAAAFVTDEGGILCHAAIVSREMKKPCIIGTKKATKLLRDGDMVEVNANTGIVTPLHKVRK
jgi:phosphohistidine swiveling domain-containing protein